MEIIVEVTDSIFNGSNMNTAKEDMEPSECPQCGGRNLENSAHEAISTVSNEPQRVCSDCGTLVDLEVGLHLGRGYLDEIVPRRYPLSDSFDGASTEFKSFTDEHGLETVDCSHMENCHLIFDNCPNLGKIKSVGTSLYDDPSASGYAKVSLNSLPGRDIELEGGIHTIEILSDYDRLSSGLGGSPVGAFMPLSTEGVARNARICINNPDEEKTRDVEHLVIVFQGDENPSEVSIADGSDVRFVGLMGGIGIKKVSVNCKRGASRVTIQGMRDLETVEIRGSTQVLDIHRCPNLSRVSGSGNTLIITNGDREDIEHVQISGFWIKTPRKVISDHSEMGVEDISTCVDLRHACFSSLSYVSACEIEEEIGLPVNISSEGPNLPSLNICSFVETMSRNIELVPRLIDWFPRLPLLQDQYYMMRVLAALSHNGASPAHISEVRSHVLYQNLNNFIFSPHYAERFVSPRMVETGSSVIFPIDAEDNISKTMEELHYKAVIGSKKDWVDEPNPWNRPLKSFIPLDRIDFELWVMTGSEKTPGIPGIPTTRNKYGGRAISLAPHDFPMWMSEILPSLLSNRDRNGIEEKIDSFSGEIFEIASKPQFGGELANEIPDLYDTIAYHLSNETLTPSRHKDRFEERFIEHLSSTSFTAPWVKAAIAYGVIQHGTGMSLKWKFLIKGLINDLPISEATKLRIPSIGGAKAFSDGLVPNLDWPYVENWRLENERN